MPSRKRKETLKFVEGLLCAADEIDIYAEFGAALHPREKLHGKFNIGNATPEEVREMGKYQARVVLVSLAAELALKVAWERENPGKTAAAKHDLQHWFKKLPGPLRKKIEIEYRERTILPKSGWKTAGQVFGKCKDSSLEWRYIVEEGEGPEDIMRATYLKEATLSVVAATRETSNEG